MRYWVAETRGAEIGKLQSLGFVTMHPWMDEYVFLLVDDKNKKFLRREDSLQIHYMKDGREYVTISQAEMEKMYKVHPVSQYKVGSRVFVEKGYGSNLEGVITSIDGDTLQLSLEGYEQNYELKAKKSDVILIDEDKPTTDPTAVQS